MCPARTGADSITASSKKSTALEHAEAKDGSSLYPRTPNRPSGPQSDMRRRRTLGSLKHSLDGVFRSPPA